MTWRHEQRKRKLQPLVKQSAFLPSQGAPLMKGGQDLVMKHDSVKGSNPESFQQRKIIIMIHVQMSKQKATGGAGEVKKSLRIDGVFAWSFHDYAILARSLAVVWGVNVGSSIFHMWSVGFVSILLPWRMTILREEHVSGCSAY